MKKTLVVFLASVAFLLSFTWAETPKTEAQQQQIRQLMAQGDVLYGQGKLAEALEAYKKVQSLDP